MTNIQSKRDVNNVNDKNPIPIGKWAVDSFKILIDKDAFTDVNIDHEVSVIDNATGEVLEVQKKHMKKVPYNGQTVYISTFTKTLRGKRIEKVIIIFSSNVNGSSYFDGISKENVYDVFDHLKRLRLVDFKCKRRVYSACTVKDIDVKKDLKFSRKDKEKIKEWNRLLKSYFNGYPDNCKVYDSQSEGLGLQANFRDNSSYTKPFLKFYSKYTEMRKKHPEIWECLPTQTQNFLLQNFVYRFEFTIKNNEYCKKLGIGNRLHEIMSLSQEKLAEIGKYMYNVNFKYRPKTSRMKGKLTQTEKILARYMFQDIQDHGKSVHEVRDIFMMDADTANRNKHRALARFDKIYGYITGEGANEIQESANFRKQWYQQLGFE